MASSKLNLQHPQFEVTKQAPIGFSWTVLFFGCFPPFLRGDWKWGLAADVEHWKEKFFKTF